MLETSPSPWAPLAPVHASAAFFAPGQYYAQPALAPPPQPQGYLDTYYLPWPQLPVAPPSCTPSSPLGCRQVEAYIQQHDKVLCSLLISPAEFAKSVHALLVSLRHHDLSGTPEQWADCLLKFHKLYQCRTIPKSAQNTLRVDLNLQDKLCALMDKIHTSLNLRHFEDPVNSVCLFHVQREGLIKLWDHIPALVPRQQEELNAAFNILKALNPTRGLFDQPAAHTIGLSARPCANSLLSAFHTWGQPADTNPHADAPPPPPTNNENTPTHTPSYINELEAPGSGSAPPSRVPTPEFQCDRPHLNLRQLHGNALPPCNNPPPLRQPAAHIPGPTPVSYAPCSQQYHCICGHCVCHVRICPVD
ncbi:hypothetical protein C0993_012213 [Termitomyces sp. T159_Od127]|nr:hypothetical protein C0993_012213 [Termitomyces sp. T159_Od127]